MDLPQEAAAPTLVLQATSSLATRQWCSISSPPACTGLRSPTSTVPGATIDRHFPGIEPQPAAKGHTVVEKNAMGSTQSILRTEDGFFGAADPRRPGALAIGY